jgi:hypothetical protein
MEITGVNSDSLLTTYGYATYNLPQELGEDRPNVSSFGFSRLSNHLGSFLASGTGVGTTAEPVVLIPHTIL